MNTSLNLNLLRYPNVCSFNKALALSVWFVKCLCLVGVKTHFDHSRSSRQRWIHESRHLCCVCLSLVNLRFRVKKQATISGDICLRKVCLFSHIKEDNQSLVYTYKFRFQAVKSDRNNIQTILVSRLSFVFVSLVLDVTKYVIIFV